MDHILKVELLSQTLRLHLSNLLQLLQVKQLVETIVEAQQLQTCFVLGEVIVKRLSSDDFLDSLGITNLLFSLLWSFDCC